MPRLLRRTPAGWSICDEIDTTWQAEDTWSPGDALQISVDSEPTTEWLQASAIAINFPALTDGRGLSLAVLLRTRMGFSGDLVARGNIHEDIAHFLARCGFSVLELPEGKDLESALRWITPHTGYYQESVAQLHTQTPCSS